jgi:hypothetical protein
MRSHRLASGSAIWNRRGMSEQLILSDGGLETTLVFHEGVELPHFAGLPPA